MKKFIIIFGVFLALVTNAKAEVNNERKLTEEEIDEIYGKCEDMIISMEEFEGALGKVFADQHNAGRVIWCFSDKIKQHSKLKHEQKNSWMLYSIIKGIGLFIRNDLN